MTIFGIHSAGGSWYVSWRCEDCGRGGSAISGFRAAFSANEHACLPPVTTPPDWYTMAAAERNAAEHAAAPGVYPCPGCGFRFRSPVTSECQYCGYQPPVQFGPFASDHMKQIVSKVLSRETAPDPDPAAEIRAVICEPLGLSEAALPAYGQPGPDQCRECLGYRGAGTGKAALCVYCATRIRLAADRAGRQLNAPRQPRNPDALILALLGALVIVIGVAKEIIPMALAGAFVCFVAMILGIASWRHGR